MSRKREEEEARVFLPKNVNFNMGSCVTYDRPRGGGRAVRVPEKEHKWWLGLSVLVGCGGGAWRYRVWGYR